MCVFRNVVYGKAVSRIKNTLGILQLGRVKNRYAVRMLDTTNRGCKLVDQHWDNEVRSGYTMGIKSTLNVANIIEDKRVKNSIFMLIINMVKTKNINIYLRRGKKFFKEKEFDSRGENKRFPF